MIRRQLEMDGFVNLGVLNPELDTLTVANKIGTIIKIQGLSEGQRLAPRAKGDFPKNTYSGNYGTDEFPLHTDLAHWYQPPRYFLLRCLVPDPKVSTFIFNFQAALSGLAPVTISRALFKPRRKVENRQFLLRLKRKEIFRWDCLYLVPDNTEAEEVSLHLNSLEKNQFHSIKLKDKGQVVLIDNWKVLHGRGSILESSNARLIERVYLSEVNL